MRACRVLPGLAALTVALVLALALTSVATGASEITDVAVDRSEIAARLGGKFSFQTTITNSAASETVPLIAHLNILSLRDGVYVDPEDWSTQRTRYLGTIPAQKAQTLTWDLTAVASGSFAAYVSVLPQDDPVAPPDTSSTIHVAVEERKTINSGGILPLVLGIPAAVALFTGSMRLTRRRR